MLKIKNVISRTIDHRNNKNDDSFLARLESITHTYEKKSPWKIAIQ